MGIVDTGVYMEHEEFEGRVTWLADTAEDPSPKTDTNGHGTHVAGTILSKEYGIAKGAVGKAVRVLGTNGFGTTVGVIEGVEATVTDHQKNRKKRYLNAVANMSLGGSYSFALNNAVKAAVEAALSTSWRRVTSPATLATGPPHPKKQPSLWLALTVTMTFAISQITEIASIFLPLATESRRPGLGIVWPRKLFLVPA